MSAVGGASSRRRDDPAWRATALTGTALLAALVLALAARGDGLRIAAVALAAGAVPAIAVVLGPGAVRALRGADHRAVGLGVPVGMVLALLVVTRVSGSARSALLGVALLAACAASSSSAPTCTSARSARGGAPSAPRGSR